MGDFNVGDIEWKFGLDDKYLVPFNVRSTIEIAIIDLFSQFNLVQINNFCNSLNRQLDLVFVDKEFDTSIDIVKVPVIQNTIHHKSVCLEVTFFDYIRNVENSSTKTFDFKRADFNVINRFFTAIPWNTLLSEINLDHAYNFFSHHLKYALEEFVPKKQIKKNSNPPWYNNRLSNLKNRKIKAYKLYKRDKNNSFFHLKYLQSLKEFDYLNKFLYNSYVLSAESKVKTNSKHFWTFINNKRKSIGLPNCMQYLEETSRDTATICKFFANYFKSVYCSSSPTILRDFSSSNQVSLGNLQLNPSDVFCALTCLDVNKSVGPDGISPIFLKECATSLALPLCIIFNLSLRTGNFLNEWKVSYISPIFKAGSKRVVSNYRPICKLSAIPKVFEKIVCNKLNFAVKEIISDSQHGFVQGRSTATNLAILCEKVVTNFELGYQTDIIFTDFAKAFDRVNHRVLIAKLKSIGFDSSLLDWISSYLQDRIQYVKIGGSLSEPIFVTSGVPQGSHIGPLLFVLFVNDIPSYIRNSTCLLFADDLKIFHSIQTVDDCLLLQEDLNRLASWCQHNLLDLNVSKCQSLTCLRCINPITFNYQINNVELENVNFKKDLGVILDPQLTFNSHVDYIVSNAFRMLGFIRRNTKEFSDPYALKALYFAFVRSVLDYCSTIWNPYYHNHSLRIERVQKCFTRFVFKKLRWNIDTPPYLTRCLLFNILTLEDRRKYFSIMFIRDIINYHIKCPYLLGRINFYFPARNLRTRFHIRGQFHRTNYGSNEPIERCTNEVNSVIDRIDLFENCSRNSFKKQLMSVLYHSN